MNLLQALQWLQVLRVYILIFGGMVFSFLIWEVQNFESLQNRLDLFNGPGFIRVKPYPVSLNL